MVSTIAANPVGGKGPPTVVNSLDVLIGRPDELAEARAAALTDDPAAVDGFVFEALRFRPAFPYFFRTCEQDAVLGRGEGYETPIPKGTKILAVTHSAMFDPKALSRPDDFDPTRGLGNQFHFGLGLHECLGRAIGRVMIPLRPGGWVILIQTRWHEDDLAGRSRQKTPRR
jgi:cytochrome P450